MRALTLAALLVVAPLALASSVHKSTTVDDPVAGQVLNGQYVVRGRVNSLYETVIAVDVQVDGGLWRPAKFAACGPCYGHPFTFDLDTRPHADGAHTIGARARAHNGPSFSEPVSVIFHNLPDVAFASPEPGSTIVGQATFSGTVAPATASLTLTVGTRTYPAASDGTGNWSAVVDTTKLPNGASTFVVEATADGRTESARLDVTLANPPTRDLRPQQMSCTYTSSGCAGTLLVRNEGNEGSGTFTVRVEYQHRGIWRPATEFQMTVAPFSAAVQSFEWSPPATTVGTFPARARVDATSTVEETDETNNVVGGTMTSRVPLVPGLVVP